MLTTQAVYPQHADAQTKAQTGLVSRRTWAQGQLLPPTLEWALSPPQAWAVGLTLWGSEQDGPRQGRASMTAYVCVNMRKFVEFSFAQSKTSLDAYLTPRLPGDLQSSLKNLGL